ncbi:MAG: DUF177 domain-containing protein [Oscillospiraceae bacterium]|nr:DUF177 domain-containing protein [Oscillospiraceae bacterium]
MVLELESVFRTPGLAVSFDYALPVQEAEMLPIDDTMSAISFAARPSVKGIVQNRTGIVELQGVANIRIQTQCDRCATPFIYTAQIPLRHTLVLALNDETNSDLVLLESARYDIDPLVWEDIVFALPSKMLCRSDCKGICQQCGANLNESACDCARPVDPRLAVLRSLLEND